MEYLMSQLGGGKQLRLIYRMTRDGVMGKDFHAKCDDKGPTFSVFKTTKGKRCGGYTNLSWENTVGGKQKDDSSAFLLSFDNKMKFNVNKTSDAISCNSEFGPWFGFSHLGAWEPFDYEDRCVCFARYSHY